MERSDSDRISVIGDMVVSDRRKVTSLETSKASTNIPINVIEVAGGVGIVIPVHRQVGHSITWPKFTDKHRLIILGVLTGVAIIVTSTITAPYWYHRVFSKSSYAAVVNKQTDPKIFAVPYNPLYLAIPTSKSAAKIASITSANDQLVLGTQTVTIPSTTINSWLNITYNKNKTETYINVNPTTVSSSINQLAAQNITGPINTVQAPENGQTINIVNGTSGSALASPSVLTADGQSAAKLVIAGKSFSLNAPLTTVSPQVVSVASMGKVLDANVTTKQMYAFDNGQLVNTFLVTAGKPSTPTPLGEFHIWEKLTEQTMTGPGYVQPDVHWINYFDHSGDAVHGNYWRPSSYFGHINSSHGCVSVQDPQAEWIYNWAPIGTTVITHA